MTIADEATSLTTKIRTAIAYGTPLTGQDLRAMQTFIADVKTANDALAALVDTLSTDIAAQMAILVAKGTADAHVEIAACNTLLTADAAAAVAAKPATISYVHNNTLDGDVA